MPVGKYRMHALLVSLKNGQGHWTLRFASDATTSSEWIEVRKEQTARFDPLGSLALRATSSLGHADGETTLRITPFVTTTTGMYLTGSWAGASAARSQWCADTFDGGYDDCRYRQFRIHVRRVLPGLVSSTAQYRSDSDHDRVGVQFRPARGDGHRSGGPCAVAVAVEAGGSEA